MRVSSYALAATVVVLGLPSIGCNDSSNTITEPTLGALEIAVTTTGESIDLDGDGFQFSVDGKPVVPVGVNAVVMFGNIPAARHEVELQGLAANCSAVGGNKRSVDVIAGGKVTATFGVSCLANTGSLRLTTMTDGPDADLNQYTVAIPGIGPVDLDANGTRTLDNVRVGSFRLTLTNVPSSCTAPGTPEAKVEFGASIEVVLIVHCYSSALIASIAYVSGDGGNADIYVINPNGTGNVRITTQSGADVDPAWSPDHSKIAFASDRNGNRQIYVMNADGTNPVRLTSDSRPDYQPAWSPNGERIAFVSERDGNPEIYVIDADGKNETRLTNDIRSDLEPDWSPDGRRIAFHRDNWQFDPTNGIYTMRSDGTDVTQLTVGYRGDWQPAWSPDGRKIAFARTSYYTTDICIVNADGTAEVQLTRSSTDFINPAWSPDGSLIAFASIFNEGGSEIGIVASDGSSPASISTVLMNASQPAFNPAWR